MRQNVAYSISAALLTAFFVSLILVIAYLLTGLTSYRSLWLAIGLVIFFALVFEPVRDFFQRFFERIIFRTRFQYKNILDKYSDALAQPTADLNRFAGLAPYLLTRTIKLSAASFMVYDREKHLYLVRAGEGEARKQIGNY